jgi:hypothetical protein
MLWLTSAREFGEGFHLSAENFQMNLAEDSCADFKLMKLIVNS